jgi:hypothetical protein
MTSGTISNDIYKRFTCACVMSDSISESNFAVGRITVNMKRKADHPDWICLFLLLLIIVKAGVIPMIYVDYELRRDYITKNICVNRNRPQLHCAGKCYLAKKIDENQKQEQKTAESGYLASLIYLVTQPENFFSFKALCSKMLVGITRFPYTSAFVPAEICSGVFRPPIYAAS